MSADEPGLPSTLPGATQSLPPDSFSDVDSDIGEWVRDLAPEGLPAVPQRALAPGHRIGVHFEVRARLGEGGMGVVYLARDDRLDREVAIKLVGRRSDRATARLAREAQAMAQLSHPNVLVVHEVGEHAGSVYIAMEFVDGPTLRAWQEQRVRTWEALLEVYLQAARGLAAAHAAGLVHRDFKPDNVLVGRDGRVRVADFGLARAQHDSVSTSDVSSGESSGTRPRKPELAVLTRTDAVLGTPAYMAPEQHGRAHVTPAVDQFAFGVALHEALWGRRPFGELPNWLASEDDRVAITDARGAPRWLRRLVRRMTAFDPRARLPGMDDVVAALERGLRRTRRLPLLAGVVGVAGLAAAIGIGVGMGSRPDPCGDAERIARAVWSDDLRARVDQAFADDGSAAHDGWLRLRDEVDAWFGGWASARRAACEATRVHGSQSEALLDRGVACFENRLEQARGTAAFLAADADARDRVVDVLAGLPAYDECSRADYLLASVRTPEDAGVRERVAALETEITTAGLELEVGHLDAADGRLRDAARVAETIAWPPLHAHLERERARLDIVRGELGPAALRLRAAYFAARAFGDDENAAGVALLLGFIAGVEQGDRLQAELWLDHAAADLARGAAPASTAIALAVTRSQVLQRAGENEAAIEVLQAALRDQPVSRDPARETAVQVELAAALDASGRHREALTAYDDLIERLSGIYGPESPQLEHLYNNRGLCRYLLQDNDGAADDLRRAIAIASRDDPMAFESAPPLLNLGLALAAGGRLDEALETLEQARKIYAAQPDAASDVALVLNAMGWVEQNRLHDVAARALHTEALAKQRTVLPDTHPEVAITYAHLGESELAAGDVEAAVTHLEQAVALSSDSSHDVGEDLPTHLGGLAAAYLAAGRLDDARARVAEVLRLHAREGVDGRDLGRARFVLARIEAAQDRPQEALAEARRARDAYAERTDVSTPRDTAEADAVQRWIDAHAATP